jgi:hypothetical protein
MKRQYAKMFGMLLPPFGDLSHTSILYYFTIRDQKLKTFPYVTNIR